MKSIGSFEKHVCEPDQEIRLYAVYGEQRIHVFTLAMGSGLCIYSNEPFIEALPNDELDRLDALLNELQEQACAYPIAIPANISGKLARLASLNKEREILSREIREAVNVRYGIELGDTWYGDSVSDITATNFVEGEVIECHGKHYLNVPGRKLASENHPGHYVYQIAGYCEDDFSGTQYIKLWGKGTYLALDFQV